MEVIDASMWVEKGELFEDAGDVGGDIQVGKAFDRRWVHRELPGRVLTIAAYPIQGDGSTPMPPEDAPVHVQWQIQKTICTDIEDRAARSSGRRSPTPTCRSGTRGRSPR